MIGSLFGRAALAIRAACLLASGPDARGQERATYRAPMRPAPYRRAPTGRQVTSSWPAASVWTLYSRGRAGHA